MAIPRSAPSPARAACTSRQDPSIRSSLFLEVEGAVVIVDEAHNVEGTCRDAGSMELTIVDMLNIAFDLCRLDQVSKFQ